MLELELHLQFLEKQWEEFRRANLWADYRALQKQERAVGIGQQSAKYEDQLFKWEDKKTQLKIRIDSWGRWKDGYKKESNLWDCKKWKSVSWICHYFWRIWVIHKMLEILQSLGPS